MTNDAWHSMRASDADRERASDVVKAAVTEGRISWDEHHARLRQVLNARTYAELNHAVRDLPTGVTPQPAAGPPAVPHGYPAAPGQVPPYGYPPVRRPTNSLAMASAVLGGLGFVTGLSSVAAIVTGHMALNRIKRTGEEGRGLAVAGLAMGYTVALGGLLLMLFFFGVVFVGSGFYL
ncbi:DUF1707 and DUF4190 domain-containing protein [Phytoactinopolyspora limicola]|uniref:DUF1707 and DUF4190 domain-containing protein n=1 Tax=Phytoactinopolyspora limicola TaxID=2715536 RepID=UPI0014081E0F|nr:DUF1707 and DUF4190 domain-containing protein [Phytoactinopolyspora limicola]